MHDDRIAILRLVLSVIAAAILLVGCQPVRVADEPDSHITGIRLSVNAADKQFIALAKENKRILDRDYSKEREYYPSRAAENSRPKTGLALSGGGMRSASFSIGVMTGLAKEPDVFNSIDIMSAVSGGSYALSWYYLQQYYMQDLSCPAQSSARLLKSDGPFQKRLAEHGWLTSGYRGLLWSAFDMLLIPFNIISNGIFGNHTNTAISRDWYEKRIEQMFHRVPEEACENRTNGYFMPDLASNWFTLGLNKESATFPQLAKFLRERERKLPFFIINTTVQLDDDPWHRGAKFSNSVFEFTPLHLGSSGVHFAHWGEDPCSGFILKSGEKEKKKKLEAAPMSVARAVSISGAAVDSNAIIAGAPQKVLTAMFNQDLGYYMQNYNTPPSCTDEVWHNVRFIPFYFWHYYTKDQHGVKLYLTDGGHSENLGAFSLVRRLPERIIIVDAEQDYDEEECDKCKYGYLFEGYRKLKAGLKAEMGVDLKVPKIDEIIGKNLQFEDGPYSRISPYNTKESCLDGTIDYFPYVSKEETTPGVVHIDVKYIKLSIDVNKLSDYPESVRIYYHNSRKGEGDKYCSRPLNLKIFDPRCTFPQESTAEQAYSADQFNAYRDLGKWIVEKQCNLKNWVQSRH